MTIAQSQAQQPRLKLAISACLLGNEVRYNGGHKQSQLCSQTLARHFDFQPLCRKWPFGLGTRASRSVWSAIRRRRARSAASPASVTSPRR